MNDTKRSIKYMRLSIEDDELDGIIRAESNSIISQRQILNQYISSHPELGSDFEEIIDDGFTGTNFKRPGMEKLIRLVEAGEVNTIIVKDLSRFGRNYLEAGYYIELVFPAYQVRLIAVTDCYDNARQDDSGGDIGLALNNIKNEMYSRELSAKVKSTMEIQRCNGQYAGSVPYGYLISSSTHEIVIDPDAALVVKKIFHMAADEHLKTPEIARRLNAEGIPSPSLYRAQKRNYKGKVQQFWSVDSVYRILISRFHTGFFEKYQSHKTGVGSKTISIIPRKQRTAIRSTHEAIVSESVYEEAQKVITRSPSKRKRETRKPPTEPILARYLKCGCCGCKLYQTHWGDPHYECRNARWRVDGQCGQVNCDAVALESVVFHSIVKLVGLADQEAQENRTAVQDAEERGAKLKNAIRSLKDKRKAINEHKVELYEQLKCGELTLQNFKEAKQAYNDEEAVLQSQLELNVEELESVRTEIEALSQAAETSVLPPVTEDHLTPEILTTFVQKVVIHPDGSPEIIYKVKDVFHP